MRILLVEDDISYARLVQEALSHDPSLRVVRVATWQEADRRLHEGGFDAVILDLSLPDSEPGQTLHHVRQSRPEVTVVVVSSTVETLDDRISLLQLGAQEAFSKDAMNLDRLPETLRLATARQQFVGGLEMSRRSAEQRGDRMERDLAWFDDLRRQVGVTEPALGIQSLSEGAPDLFDQLVQGYRELIDGAVRRAMYRDQPHQGPMVRQFASRLAALRLGPREITEIHSQALRRTAREGRDPQSAHLSAEGRLLLVEVMGYVLAAYRNQAFSRIGSRGSPNRPSVL